MNDHDDPLEYALDRMATTGPRPSWPDGKELRRRATRRRRRHLAGGTLVVAVVTASAVIAATVLSSPHHPTQTSTPPPTHTKLSGGSRVSVSAQPDGSGASHLVAVVRGRVLPAAGTETAATLARDETSFALALTQQLAGRDASNIVDSPLSADMALSMLELGARGSTRAGIATTLDASTLSAAQQAAGWAELQASLRASPKADRLKVANSAWLQQTVRFTPAYLAQLAQSFGDDAYQADFADDSPQATDDINAWVARETDGRIKQLFTTPLSPLTIFVLANALHFKAAWAPSVGMQSVGQEPFASPAGRIAVPAIGAEGSPLRATVTKAYTAVAVPYRGGRYQALVVQPDATSLTRYLDGLDGAGLARVVASLRSSTVHLTMPSLSLSASTPLKRPLSALGMSAAFGPAADLSGLSSQAAQVAEVQQADRLIVDKQGTDASAVTAVVGIASSARVPIRPLTITINRPYLLFLRDAKTGLILMTAAVDDPAAS